jgi:GNAT superfamily N-acetyltransferase
VRINTWRSAYRGIMSDAILQGLSAEEDVLRWEQRLATPPSEDWFAFVDVDKAGQVMGFCCGGRERDSDAQEDSGEVYALYVLPEQQRRGVGRALLEAAARRLRANRFERLLIWVLAENPARRFYEKMGGVAVRRREIDIRGELYSEVGYVWEALDDLAGEILSCD